MLRDEDLLDPKREPDDLSWAQALIGQPVSEAAPVQDGPTVDERLAAALAARPAVDPEAGRYEREFAEQNQQQPGWQRTLARVAAGIAESTGTKGAIENLRSQENAYQQRYGQGLTDARQRDKQHAFADPALVRLLSEAGLSPEEAAQTRGDSEALRYLPALGSLDLRRRGQELAAQQKEAALAAQDERQLRQIEAADTRQDRSIEAAATRQDKALAAKKKGGGGGGAAIDPAQMESLRMVYITQLANATDAEAKAVLAGDESGVDPAKAARIRNSNVAFDGIKPGKRGEEVAKITSREGAGDDTLERGLEAKRRNPKELLALKNEIDSKGAEIAAARNAWRKMSPGAKAAMAKYGGEGGTIARMIRDMNMSEQDKVYASELQQLANALIKAQSGAAVSDGEWGRLADRMGFASKDFDVMNSPATIENWIARMQEGAIRLKRNAIAVYKEPLSSLWGSKNVGP